MRVSVIIPNYNHANFLDKRINSVLNQTFRDFELILLDDQSTDNSWDIIQSYAGHEKVSQVIRNERNSGSPFSQWKRGIELAKGELIWIAESDDYCEPNFLETLVHLHTDKVAVAYCKSIWVDENDVPNKPIPYDPNDRWDHSFTNKGIEEIRLAMGKDNKIPNASAAVFKKPQGFPDTIINMRYAGDWYFWIWMLQFGDIAYTPEKLNYFRKHYASSRQVKSTSEELARFNENLKVIKYALELQETPLNKDIIDNYRWLAAKLHRNLAHNTRLSFEYWNPPIPRLFKKMYYQTLLLTLKERLQRN